MFSCPHVVERKPRAERPLDKEESVGSLSGNEHPEGESTTVVFLSNENMHLWQQYQIFMLPIQSNPISDNAASWDTVISHSNTNMR